ncbi:MAG: transcription antitermination factor NusB [bacterium]
MPGRRAAREVALQLLYYLERVGGEAEGELDRFWRLYPVEEEARDFAETLVRKTLERKEELSRLVSEASERWSLGRMDSVSRCVLLMGACEIYYFPDVPPKAAIDEAVELAKRYGPAPASGFVNGILDRLLRERTPA